MNAAPAGLARALAALDTPEDAAAFLAEILTEAELRDVALRWELMELLAQGVPQRQIAARLGVSLCKITRGARILKAPRSVSARVLSAAS